MAVNVNRRSMMTLFSQSDDPYSHRVRIVLAEKGVTFEVIDMNSSVKSMEMLAEYNPYVTVPTLVDRDLVLYKSEIIMEYLDERFPHPPLMPVYPVAKSRFRLMIHRINKDWYALMNSILNKKSDFLTVEKARKDLANSIASVTQVFIEMPYFLSEDFSLVDCCIASILWRLPKLGVVLSPETQPVLDYAEKIFQRESFKQSLTDEEKMLRM